MAKDFMNGKVHLGDINVDFMKSEAIQLDCIQSHYYSVIVSILVSLVHFLNILLLYKYISYFCVRVYVDLEVEKG